MHKYCTQIKFKVKQKSEGEKNKTKKQQTKNTDNPSCMHQTFPPQYLPKQELSIVTCFLGLIYFAKNMQNWFWPFSWAFGIF